MKILQIGKYYHPVLGGIETVVRNISEGLVAQGHEVTVICYAPDAPEITEEQLEGVRVIRVPMKGTLFSQPISFAYRKTILKHAPSYDLLHFHVPNPLAELSALSLPSKTRYVATFHAQIVRQKFLLPFYRPLVRHFLSGAQRILIPTQKHLTSSSFLNGFTERCVVVPFGIRGLGGASPAPSFSFGKTAEELKNRYGEFVLFVGRLVPYKGLRYLISAMGLLKTQHPLLKLVIVGEGPEEFSLMTQVAELGLQNQVHFVGRVSEDQELKAYYEACQFFVLPSISSAEAFGLVLLEAMQASKALITTELDSGVSEVNVHQATGLQVPPCNIPLLADALAKLAQNPALRTQMGVAGNLRLATHFSHEKMVTAHIRIYLEALHTSAL